MRGGGAAAKHRRSIRLCTRIRSDDSGKYLFVNNRNVNLFAFSYINATKIIYLCVCVYVARLGGKVFVASKKWMLNVNVCVNLGKYVCGNKTELQIF